jgi:hypothetical protein
MLRSELVDALQFNNDLSVYDDVSAKFAYGLTLVNDLENALPQDAKAAFFKFEKQGSFINLLEETAPQGVDNLEG